MNEFLKSEIGKVLGGHRFHCIGIQFPEGMKRQALNIADYIKNKYNIDVILSGDPCYGACDVAMDMKSLGAELILHFGHSVLKQNDTDSKSKIVFIECPMDVKIPQVMVHRLCDELKESKRIGLVTTIQFIHLLPELKKILETKGYVVYIGKPNKRAKLAGQVLGCDITAATSIDRFVDCFVYIGSGEFHPSGLAIQSDKNIVILDIEIGIVKTLKSEKDRFLRRRWAMIEKAKNGNKYGIIVSTKSGQKRLALAKKLVTLIRKSGKIGFIIALREVNPDAMLAFDADVFVSTACPRIAIDDSDNYHKPLITPYELEIVIGKRKWESYQLDTF